MKPSITRSQILLVAGCVVVAVLICWLISRVAYGFPFMAVHQEELRRVTSPDGRREAVLFFTDAGATTSTAYFVDIVRPGGSPDPARAPLGFQRLAEPKGAIQIEWTSDSNVVVTSPACELFRQQRPPGEFSYVFLELKQRATQGDNGPLWAPGAR